ncbi:hypothetical protein [Methylobacterium oryzae]|uniref:hypothetical protein n=1 Tax=Methylobacterium oryzae TaxID=334852 RepID=UPI002F35273F
MKAATAEAAAVEAAATEAAGVGAVRRERDGRQKGGRNKCHTGHGKAQLDVWCVNHSTPLQAGVSKLEYCHRRGSRSLTVILLEAGVGFRETSPEGRLIEAAQLARV